MKFNNSGGSNLLLVLVIALVLMLLSTAIQLFALLSTKLSTQAVQIQTVEFAAEGAMFATISELKQEDWPPSLPYEDTLDFGDTKITRRVLETTGAGDENLMIEIIANRNGVVRQLEGVFETSISIETSAGNVPADPNNEFVTRDKIDFYEKKSTGEEIIVKPGETLLVKNTSFSPPIIEYIYNDTSSDKKHWTKSYRRWLCHGKCPQFEMESPQSFLPKGNVEAGSVVRVSEIALLDDDPTALDPNGKRETHVQIEGNDVDNGCTEGYVAPPCFYTVTEADILKYDSDGDGKVSVGVDFGDSVMVYIPEGQDNYVLEPSEAKKRNYNFYYYEVEPDAIN